MPLTGHCNCNAVQITVQDQASGEPYPNIYCHCTTCKRQSGASGTYIIVADNEAVDIKDPKGFQKTWKDTLTDSGTPATRYFCGECGTPLITRTPLLPTKTVVKLGLFDDIPPVVSEWYTKNKHSWESTVEGAQLEKTAPS